MVAQCSSSQEFQLFPPRVASPLLMFNQFISIALVSPMLPQTCISSHKVLQVALFLLIVCVTPTRIPIHSISRTLSPSSGHFPLKRFNISTAHCVLNFLRQSTAHMPVYLSTKSLFVSRLLLHICPHKSLITRAWVSSAPASAHGAKQLTGPTSTRGCYSVHCAVHCSWR